MASVITSAVRRQPTRLVQIAEGLWVAEPSPVARQPETAQQRVARHFVRREIFARPLVPRCSRASACEAEAGRSASGESGPSN